MKPQKKEGIMKEPQNTPSTWLRTYLTQHTPSFIQFSSIQRYRLWVVWSSVF